MNDVSNSEIAKTCNFAVVSVDYRLAPEHPYPAGPDDCEAVAKWLIDNSESEFGTSRLVDRRRVRRRESGGDHLAPGARQDRRHRQVRRCQPRLRRVRPDGIARARANASDDSLVLRRTDMEAFGRLYLGDDDYESRVDPDVSPLYADLSGLPPALFTVGGADPLLDDSLFMAARWQVAGNHAELAFYPECPHGFDMFPSKAALKARARQMQWMASAAQIGASGRRLGSVVASADGAIRTARRHRAPAAISALSAALARISRFHAREPDHGRRGRVRGLPADGLLTRRRSREPDPARPASCRVDVRRVDRRRHRQAQVAPRHPGVARSVQRGSRRRRDAPPSTGVAAVRHLGCSLQE